MYNRKRSRSECNTKRHELSQPNTKRNEYTYQNEWFPFQRIYCKYIQEKTASFLLTTAFTTGILTSFFFINFVSYM